MMYAITGITCFILGLVLYPFFLTLGIRFRYWRARNKPPIEVTLKDTGWDGKMGPMKVSPPKQKIRI